MTTQHDDTFVFAIERPDAKLWTYYIVTSLLLGPLFFVALIPLYFRYHTLHYKFDREGISMGWGILFRREIHLTYSRIQDIHLVANFVERWLGLARIQIQTASGSSNAEMTLEGLLNTDSVRDFLYSRMRGARDGRQGRQGAAPIEPGISDGVELSSPTLVPGTEAAPPVHLAPLTSTAAGDQELAAVLSEVAAELRSVRLALEASRDRPIDDARR